MRIPVYLKETTEVRAVLVGAVDLLPVELDRSAIDRSIQLDGTTKTVRLDLEKGPYGVPFATHSVAPFDYGEAEHFWYLKGLQDLDAAVQRMKPATVA